MIIPRNTDQPRDALFDLAAKIRADRTFDPQPLAFDNMPRSTDRRLQELEDISVIFHKGQHQRRCTATFIDFGYCFNAGEWSFPDSSLRGVYFLNEVYEGIESWDDFAPWLERVEEFSARQLQKVADEIPCEWYGERPELECLLHRLLERRGIVRQLIEDFRTSSRNPFPNWTMTAAIPSVATATASGDLSAM